MDDNINHERNERICNLKKEENFNRISSKRLAKLADDFRLLGNLSNTANYEYSKEDIEKMFEEIDSMYSELKRSFKRAQVRKKISFLN